MERKGKLNYLLEVVKKKKIRLLARGTFMQKKRKKKERRDRKQIKEKNEKKKGLLLNGQEK